MPDTSNLKLAQAHSDQMKRADRLEQRMAALLVERDAERERADSNFVACERIKRNWEETCAERDTLLASKHEDTKRVDWLENHIKTGHTLERLRWWVQSKLQSLRQAMDAERGTAPAPPITSTYTVWLCAACGGVVPNAYVIPSAEHACKCKPVPAK